MKMITNLGDMLPPKVHALRLSTREGKLSTWNEQKEKPLEEVLYFQ